MIETLQSVAQKVWREHFRIPETAYWVAVAVSAAVLPFAAGELLLVFGLALAMSITGVARWHWHRSRSRGGLAVPYMRTSVGARGRAEEVQRDVITALQDELPEELGRHVHSIPTTVGPESQVFARRLRRRLRARFLLYGRIADASDGWSVYPRVIEPAPGGAVFHFDPHTRELTFERKGAREPSSKLPSTVRVRDEEYPHQFARDLAAVLLATIGQIELGKSEDDDDSRARKAQELLESALETAGNSTSNQVDRLRIDLAASLEEQGEDTEALELLKGRAEGDSPSPDLLRAYALSLTHFGAPTKKSEADRMAGISALQRALKLEEDPFWWDLTLYNLINRTFGGPGENEEVLKRLDEFRTPEYRNRWDVQRLKGLRAWMRAELHRKNGDVDAARVDASEAARYYARAVRRRWRPTPTLQQRFPYVLPPSRRPSPILHANLVDARGLSGQLSRARWNERRFARLRKRYVKRSFRAIARVDARLHKIARDAKDGRVVLPDALRDDRTTARLLSKATALLDWSLVGRHDNIEATAQVWRIVVLRLMDDKPSAKYEWERVRDRNPYAEYARALAWEGGGLVQALGMPGSESLRTADAVQNYQAHAEGPALDSIFWPMPKLSKETLVLKMTSTTKPKSALGPPE